ncbi:MAG: class IV adenylate cyclase [Candidatus Methanomethylicota archaeon]|uniref:Class IV adenylate cyclase n=1 Tax=Thermoproteota archaeon TaxID=2056631 RepID=A0A497EK55_9CREN|nr:MAG: class IV adenylate cyclase [Candidatus Verstraetearchaeota archaeon]
MEVEVKFRMKNGVAEKVRAIAEFVIRKEEVDLYFSSPIKDFKETDEALRLRRDIEGITITYKGPKIDSETKSREEIKLKVDSFEKAVQLLEKLGFKPVREVRKIREIYKFGDAIICLDDVDGLGKYIEIEIESNSIEAKSEIFKIAELLGYSKNESIRDSYLELLEKISQTKTQNHRQ